MCRAQVTRAGNGESILAITEVPVKIQQIFSRHTITGKTGRNILKRIDEVIMGSLSAKD